jgi:DNA helicase-2/ATP-dependent DNA helicase PcrA
METDIGGGYRQQSYHDTQSQSQYGQSYNPSYNSTYTPRKPDEFSGKNDGIINQLIKNRGIEKETIKQDGFSKDDRIAHGKFGNGVVVHVDGNKLDIQFDDGEIKRLLATFVKKT